MSKSKPKVIRAIYDNSQLSPEVQSLPKIRKSSFSPSKFDINKDTLFETSILESSSIQYNVVSPGLGNGESCLRLKNPSLLALGNKAKVTKSQRQHVKPMLGRHIAPSAMQGVTSILSNRPLADLPEPPMQAVEKGKREQEQEKLTIDFKEDPIAYFSKRKDGRGHLFIYLKYAKDKDDLTFSPYELVKVTHSEIGKEYFTMSANGVTHFYPDGSTEVTSLDAWVKEDSIFKSIRKLRTFNKLNLWKPFRLWKFFITKKRYNEMKYKVLDFPYYYNECFSGATIALNSLLEKSDKIIAKNLLCFYPARKYSIKDFRNLCVSNLETLHDQYEEFISEITSIVCYINSFITDPNNLKVQDDEFAEIKRKNPNISQLIVLERKKYAERIRREEQMKDETIYIADFLRMADYMLLESQRNSCFQAFENAEANCLQELSAIFQVNVLFDDNGNVVFNPTVDELKNEVKEQISAVLYTVENLPRLVKAPAVRQIITNSLTEISYLFDDGPDFQTMTSSSNILQTVEEKIISIIDSSYKEAGIYVEAFKDFYPLYRLGQTWDVKSLIKTSTGEVYRGSLTFVDSDPHDKDDEFLIYPERSPMIDISEAKALIKKLKVETDRVVTFKSGNTRGIIHIDSRYLKTVLTPIPMKSLHDIENMLKELMTFKTEMMLSVFRVYSSKLKSDPNTLPEYVEFCELLQKTTELTPRIQKEISFIDELITLIEDSGFSSLKNLLHQPFQTFTEEKEAAGQVQNANYERFKFLLSQVIKEEERKLTKYKEKSIINIPITLEEHMTDSFTKQTQILKQKLIKIKPRLDSVIRYQKVLSKSDNDPNRQKVVAINTFPDYLEIEANVLFSEKLCGIIADWESLSLLTKNVPFSHIDIKEFIQSTEKLENEIKKLRETLKKPSSILNEIAVNFEEISPYLVQLTQLYNGKMQTRHWETLFEECGQSHQYNQNITIRQLITLGILSNADKINEITNSSHGESQLENDFKNLKSYWDDVDFPIKDAFLLSSNNKPKESQIFKSIFDDDEEFEDIRLAPLEPLRAEINNSAIVLNSMMKNVFVHGIIDNVRDLARNLDHIIQILDQWEKFECNWVILSNLMLQKYILSCIPSQASSFESVEDKWHEIAKFTVSNKKLLKVCAFPDLYGSLMEMNENFESVFSSLIILVDKKRELVPRFYFLSNNEIITLLSTTDFPTFSSQIVKTMMHINRFVYQKDKDSTISLNLNVSLNAITDSDDAFANYNFSDLTITGLIGDDGNTLQFINPIPINGPIEKWVPNLYSSMRDATKEAVAVSMSKYTSSGLDDWIMSVTSYVAMITAQVLFTRDIEDCFNNLETNPKIFLSYLSTLKHKIQDMNNLMTTPLSAIELTKISSLISIFISMFEKTKMFNDRLLQYSNSPNMLSQDGVDYIQQTWHDMLKFKYDTTTMDIAIQFGNYIWGHEHEYWGKASTLMLTTTVEKVILNMCQARVYDQVPLIYGPYGVGKTEIIRTFASYLGKFIYSSAAFPSFSNFFIAKILTGAALTGSWVLFSEVEQLNDSSISFLFDTIRSLNDSNSSVAKSGENTACYINESLVELNPNTRVFLTSSFTSYVGNNVNNALPPQLRSYARPIALSSPFVKKIIETKLITLGYKYAKDISEQLESLVGSLVSILKLHSSRLQHCLKIINLNHDLVTQLMHSNKVDFVNYYEDPDTTEKFSIARSAFDYFSTILDRSKIKILMDFLYMHFPLFDDFEQFKSHITDPCGFFIDKVYSTIKDVVEETSNISKEITEPNEDSNEELKHSQTLNEQNTENFSKTTPIKQHHFDPYQIPLNPSIKPHNTSRDKVKSGKLSGSVKNVPKTARPNDVKESTDIAEQVEAHSNNADFPVDYLIQKVFHLFQMMKSYKCIIIYGPPNSGKTTLVDLMSKVYKRMTSDSDLVNYFKGIKELKIETIYHNSDTWDNIFGAAVPDEIHKNIWQYGQFQTTLTYLDKFKLTHHRILRFDGKISLKFCQFIYQFVSETEYFRTNSLDTFLDDSTFHCIIETDDISNLTPDIFSVCGVMSLKNLQNHHGILNIMKETKLTYPNFTFNSIKKKFSYTITKKIEINVDSNLNQQIFPSYFENYNDDSNDLFTADEFNLLESLYVEIGPSIVEKVAKMPFVVEFEQIADKYAEKAGIYALNYIYENRITVDKTNINNLKFIFVKGFFDIFSSIIEPKHITDFENWLCQTFELNIPQDWSSMSVNEQFVRSIPKPTLASLTIINNEFSPIDYSVLSSRTIVHVEEGGSMPIFINDFVIPNEEFISPLALFEASIKTYSNILLFGPTFSGKSSLLSYVFHDFQTNNKIALSPIEISLSPFISTQEIIQTIQMQTNMLRHITIDLDKPKVFVLVFDHIDQANEHVLEFIRELVSTSTIQINSKLDPKLFDRYDLINYGNNEIKNNSTLTSSGFFVVIKAKKIINLPPRFLSHFTPIQLLEYQQNTKLSICRKSMNAFGINSDLIHIMNNIIDILQVPMSTILNIIMQISHISQRAAASEEDKVVVLKLLMSEIYFLCFKCDSTRYKEFLDKLKPVFSDTNFADAFQATIKSNDICCVHYKFANNIGKFSSEVVILNNEEMRSKLIDILKTNVSDLTLTNFYRLSLSLLRPGHNCIISSITGSARIEMCRLFASAFEFNFIDLNEINEDIISASKKIIEAALLEDKTQLMVLRINENNINDARLLCSIFSNLNIIHAFTQDELDDLIDKVAARYSHETYNDIDYNIRLKWINKIKFMIKCKCHLAFARDFIFNEEDENIFDIFDIVNIIPPSRESICENFIDKPELRTLFVSISKRIMSKKEDEMSLVPIQNYNIFYNFINIFSKLYNSDGFDTKNKIPIALDFLESISKERETFNDLMNQMKPELEQLQEHYQIKEKQIEGILSKTNEIKDKLNQEKEMKEKDIEEKKESLKHAQEDYNTVLPQMQQAKEAVDSLTEKDVEPLKLTSGMSVPPRAMMMEIITILRDESPQTEANKETVGTETQENGAEKISKQKEELRVKSENLYNDPNFLSIVKSIDPNKVTQEILDKIRPYLIEQDFQRKTMETISPILTTLFGFVNALIRYSEENIKLREATQQVEIREIALQQFLNEMNKQLEDITKEENEQQEILTQFNKLKEQKEIKEDEYNMIKSKKEKIDSILNNSDKMIQEWKSFNENGQSADTRCGDSILYALYLTHCGPCNIENRKKVLNIALEEINKAKISTSFRNPYESILAKLTSNISVSFPNVELPYSLLMDIEHILRFPQPALLIDPDKIVIDTFLNTKRAYIISINSNGFINALAESMKNGKTLFITDVDYLHQNVSLAFRLMQKTSEICINGLKFNKNPNFKPIFVTNINEPEKIPTELLTRVTIINTHSSSMTFINFSILRCFINHFDPRHMSTLIDLAKADISGVVFVNSESQILSLINKIVEKKQNDESYSYLDDELILEELITEKNNLLASRTAIETAEKGRKDMNESIAVLQPLISICNTIWLCLSRYMPKVQIHYQFQFSQFQKIVYSTLHNLNNLNTNNPNISLANLRANKMTEEQIKEVRKILLNQLLLWIAPMLSIRDMIFFMFLTAFLSLQNNFNDLSIIIDNISQKLSSSYVSEPIDLSSVDNIIEALKTVNASDFFDLTFKYVLQFFGDEVFNNFPVFQVENIISPAPMIPAMIISDHQSQNDATPLIISYVESHARMNNFVSYSLSDDDASLKIALNETISSMSYGNWVLIHYWKPSQKSAEILNKLLFLLHSTTLHTNFRLIVSLHNTDYISPFLFAESKQIILESYPSIRQIMRMIFSQNSNSLRYNTLNIPSTNNESEKESNSSSRAVSPHRSTNHLTKDTSYTSSTKNHNVVSTTTNQTLNVKSLRKIFYMASLSLSSLSFRCFVQPIGFKIFDSATLFSRCVSACKEVLDYVKPLLVIDIENNNTDQFTSIQMRNLREFVQEIAFAGQFIETQDRRCARAILATMFQPNMLEENFRFVENDSNEEKIWNPPVDTSPTNLQNHIKAMPLFQTTDIILSTHLTSMPFLKWSMAKYLSVPFLSILDESEDADDNKKDDDYEYDSDYYEYSDEKEDEIDKRFSNLDAELPRPIFSNEVEESSPLSIFWHNEIDFLNNALVIIHQDIYSRNSLIRKDIMNGIVPKKWQIITSLLTVSNLQNFFLILEAKRKFFVECLKNPVVKQVDVRLIENLKGFFEAYIHEYAYQRNTEANGITFEFSIDTTESSRDQSSPNNMSPKTQDSSLSIQSTLTLIGLSSFNCRINGNKLVPPQNDQKAFAEFPPIQCSLTNVSSFGDHYIKDGSASARGRYIEAKNTFICPMYKFLFQDCMNDEKLLSMNDNETQNYIMDVHIPTDRGDRWWLLNGSALYCHVPQMFL